MKENKVSHTFPPQKVTSQEEILDAAFAIARADGIDGLTIRKLAKSCNIAVGSMYNYFPNKEAVVDACRSRFWQEILKDQEKLTRPFMRFTDFLLQYYAFLSARLAGDDSSWLRIMDTDSREKVCTFFGQVLENDPQINGAIWSLELSPQSLVEHVRTNLLALLQAGEEDCRFLVFLLEHFLYN